MVSVVGMPIACQEERAHAGWLEVGLVKGQAKHRATRVDYERVCRIGYDAGTWAVHTQQRGFVEQAPGFPAVALCS